MRDEPVTLPPAGHETTASTPGWTFHPADRHPKVWGRPHAEATSMPGGRPPGYEDLPRLRSTTVVVDEVMRPYPPVWILPRRAQAGDEVGGHHVPAGSDVPIRPSTLHRHPAFRDAPDRFDPDRFHPDRTADHTADRPRHTRIPFDAGPRPCAGNHPGADGDHLHHGPGRPGTAAGQGTRRPGGRRSHAVAVNPRRTADDGAPHPLRDFWRKR